MLTVLEVEGDAGAAGTVDGVSPVGGTDGDRYWTTGLLANEIENGSLTLLLVEGFTGAAGDDLENGRRRAADVTPWTTVVDDVAVSDGGAPT